MNVTYCDRCKNVIKRTWDMNAGVPDEFRIERYTGGVDVQGCWTTDAMEKVDLCPKCYQAFKKFLLDAQDPGALPETEEQVE